jgi:hypothetical protein
MSIKELLESAEYLVDANGKKKAVVVDFEIWEELLTLLEDVEDSEEIKRLREAKQDYVPWEKVKAELRDAGVDV